MSIPGTKGRLRAIIRTQTEIATSDLDAESIMQLIAERAQELTRASADLIELAEGEAIHARTAAERVANQIRSAKLGDGTIGASYGLAASTNRDSDTLVAAADRVLRAAKDRLYGRRDG